jgi:hypothetical protein
MEPNREDADEIAALNELIAEQRRTIRSMQRSKSPTRVSVAVDAVSADTRCTCGSQAELSLARSQLSASRRELKFAVEAERLAAERADSAERAVADLRSSCIEREEKARSAADQLLGTIGDLQRRVAASDARAAQLERSLAAAQDQYDLSRDVVIDSQRQLLLQRAIEVAALRDVVEEQRKALGFAHPVGSARDAILKSPRRQPREDT